MKTIVLFLMLVTNWPLLSQEYVLKPEIDLVNLEGKWIGRLTYLDYTSNNPYTMPADVEIIKIDNNHYIYKNSYPNEPKANSTDTLTVSSDGKLYNGKEIKDIIRSKNKIEIITETKGIDGNDKKLATLRNYYVITPKKYTIIKDVKFEGETNWIKRHEYSFFKN